MGKQLWFEIYIACGEVQNSVCDVADCHSENKYRIVVFQS